MKKLSLLLCFILGMTNTYSQYDCSQGDGTFRYEARLNIINVPTDFDKDDFINHITSLDNISNDDLATLVEHITLVYKTFPSQNPHRTATIVSTIEIYPILDTLINSIEFHYCVVNDCSLSNGTFSYLALLTGTEVPNDFDKADFIKFVVGLDDISNEDLVILNTHITTVFKAFPGTQSEWLRRVVDIETTAEIYSILASLINSIEHHSCIGEVILEISDDNKSENSILYPNPVNSKLFIFSENLQIERLTIYSISGLVVFSEENDSNSVDVSGLSQGVYFLEITSEKEKSIQKFIKE